MRPGHIDLEYWIVHTRDCPRLDDVVRTIRGGSPSVQTGDVFHFHNSQSESHRLPVPVSSYIRKLPSFLLATSLARFRMPRW